MSACMSEKPITRSGCKRHDLVDLAVEEGRYARLLLPRTPRPHGVAADADDARLLTQQVQPFGGLLGEAIGIDCVVLAVEQVLGAPEQPQLRRQLVAVGLM